MPEQLGGGFQLDDELLKRARDVRLVGLDIDGTLTNGQLFIGAAGESHKAFHVKDGLGIKLLMQAGIEVVWITARRSDIAATRAAELGVKELIQGCREKREVLVGLAEQRGLAPNQIGFMGDDLPDLAALCWCGFAAAPADAHWALSEHLHWRSQFVGGHGAVREWADLLLCAQNQWKRAIEPFQR